MLTAYDGPQTKSWFDDFGDTDGLLAMPSRSWKEIIADAEAGQTIGPLSSNEMKDFASAVNSAVGRSIVIAPRTGLKSKLGMDQTLETEVPPTAIESQVDGKHEVGLKFDDDKPRYDLEQTLATEEVMKVLTFGARKYDDGNWKFLDKAQARYYAAARRHLAATQKGETIDPESGLHHLAHAICCLNFMLELQLESKND